MQIKTTRYHLTGVRMTVFKKTKDSVGKDTEKKGTTVHSWWECKLAQLWQKNSVEVPQKLKNRTAMWSSSSTTRYIPKGIENWILKYYLHCMLIASLSMIAKIRKQHKCPWMNEWRCFTYTHTHVWILFNQEIEPVHSRGNQSWICIGRTDAEAEAPILWPPDMKNRLIGKDPEVEKDWRQEETEMTQDKMVGWYHWFNGHEFEQVPGVGDGQGSLARCSPWGCKELDTTERLNWTELNWTIKPTERKRPCHLQQYGWTLRAREIGRTW